jgi:hypothetical protein
LPRIGVTGHMNLTPQTVALVRDAMRRVLVPHVANGLTGVSCIAVGADSIFAETILDLGGELEVILPSADYRERKVKPENAHQFDRLLQCASQVRVMPHATANRDAYEAANEALLGSSDLIIAVWDGKSPVDKGGTAAVVDDAMARGIPVDVIWPDGAARA